MTLMKAMYKTKPELLGQMWKDDEWKKRDGWCGNLYIIIIHAKRREQGSVHAVKDGVI